MADDPVVEPITIEGILASVSKQIDYASFTTNPPAGVIGIFNAALFYLAERLYRMESELVKSEEVFAYLAVENPSTAALPTGFCGFMGEEKAPWKSGTSIYLRPIPSERYERQLESKTGKPSYFKVKAATLQIYPKTDENLTLKAYCFVMPKKFEDKDSEIPWGGIYDEAFGQYVVQRFLETSAGAVGSPARATGFVPGRALLSALAVGDNIASDREGKRNNPQNGISRRYL